MIRLPRSAMAVLLLVAGLSSCDGSPTEDGEPTPGTLKVVLNSPNATDGAILIRLDGVGITNVTVSGVGRTSYLRTISATRTLVAIIGPVSDGEQLTFEVPDTRQRSSYVATAEQVADESNVLRASPHTYTLQVQR